jgi:hypothetical protein
MNSEKFDVLGWLLMVGAASLAISAAMRSGSNTTWVFAGSILLLIAIERRRAKIVTAALIRIVDEKGACWGLIGWDGEGVQIGVRAEPLNNVSVAYPILWQKAPSVAFSFMYSHAITSSGELVERSPTITVSGEMQKEWRSYSMKFSYNVAADKPDIAIDQRMGLF